LNSPIRTIVIVGGGFSGTTVAANLLRNPFHARSTRIVIVERARRLARGLAYAERPYPYLLNVPAGRMSASSLEPLDFLNFARHRLPAATADDFLPRALYGDYLEENLLSAELDAPPHVRLERVRAEACAIDRVADSSAWRIHLSDGDSLQADEVVFALGNPPPGTPAALQPLLGSPRYIEDPWGTSVTARPGDSVLVIGTSLTMADFVSHLTAGTSSVCVHAISRHGFVPPTQTPFAPVSGKAETSALIREASFSARRLMRAVRRLAAEVEAHGGDWREAVTLTRSIAPALWQRLPQRERRRFLRHIHTYWDVHRHRLPAETLAQLERLRSEKRLHVHPGRLVMAETVGEKIRVSFRPRGSHDVHTLLVDRVINCTGPDYNPRRSRDSLVHSLLSQRYAVVDALGLGLRTAANGALIDARGREANGLYCIGPQLRADHWEATAVQELRVHAERLASHLVGAAMQMLMPDSAVAGARLH
jgi:uncharacterized NAD(P)/FAD-binding protein YdhS